MIIHDIAKVIDTLSQIKTEDDVYKSFKQELRNLPKHEDLLLIDRTEVERLWPLNEFECKIVYDMHDALSDHIGKIYYLSADANIFKRYEKWLLTNPKVDFIPLMFPFTFSPKPTIVKDFLFYDETLETEINSFEEIKKQPKTKNFINLTCGPKLLRLLLLDKYYQHENFEYSYYPWHHGKSTDFQIMPIIKPLNWLSGQKIKGKNSSGRVIWYNPVDTGFLNDSAPFKELTEFSTDWTPGSLDKTNFDDFMPIEVFTTNCDIVTESYLNYDSVLFSEKTFKELIFRRPFLLLGAKNQNMFLKKMGFELYDEIFDYEFDILDTVEQRFNAYCKQIDRYIDLNPETFKNKLLCIEEKIEHNFQYILNEYKKSEIIFDLISGNYDNEDMFVDDISLKNKFDKAMPILKNYESILND